MLRRFGPRTKNRLIAHGLAATAVTVGAIAAGPAVAGAASHSVKLVKNPASYVDPFIGTGSGGPVVGQIDTFPGAVDPFGMMQWSPDTSPDRTDGGGYYYPDSQISGFSLTHLSGPGCPALGDIPILPTVGAIPSSPESVTEPFSHTSEAAHAGYYKVTTGASGQQVTTQLTVTPRTGIGTFTFPSGTSSNLLIKAADSASGESTSTVQIIGNNEIEGSVTAGHFCGGGDVYTLHFVMQFNRSFSGEGSWNGSTVSSGPTSGPVTGANTGAYVTFDTTSNRTVTAKVGISYVSGANALLNLKTEQHGFNFNKVHANATKSWNKLLNRLQVGGGTLAEKRTFYTMLYHSLIHPNIFSDVNGQYMSNTTGLSGAAPAKVETMPKGHADYANYSGWDIYRSDMPLASLVDPSVMSDVAQSMLADFQQTGMFPKWSLNNSESYIMVGDPADAILADIYAFGARKFSANTVLKDMVTEATKANCIRPGLNYLEKLGYLPVDGSYGCQNYYGDASTTLEYNTADASIAELAKALHKTGIYNRFATRAQDWENLYNPLNGFIEPKMMNGSWVSNFVPTSTDNYVEGDAYQYNWAVPFDVSALVNAEGGRAAFIKRLSTYFTQLNTGSNTPYDWDGNEPSLEDPWEFDYAGAPYLTQKTVRRIINTNYGDRPGGEPGNDDLGAMSSWYVWAALGLYPETSGTTNVVLASPLFPREVLHLQNGRALFINAKGASAKSPYIRSLTINGKRSQRNSVSLASLAVGHGKSLTLRFTLSSRPNTRWGTKASDAPPVVNTGLKPVVSSLSASQVDLVPGGRGSAKLFIRNVSNRTQVVTVTAMPASGSGVTAGDGGGVKVRLRPAGGATVKVPLFASASAAQTFSTTRVGLSANGKTASTQPLTVLVAPKGSLLRFFNNVGVSADSDPGAANFDGSGWSYSADALKGQGVTPGGTISSGGIDYTWPNVATGYPDNATADGQTIPVAGSSGDAQLAILGSANNGPSEGVATLHYSDGSTSKYYLGLTDWTLNGGGGSVAYDNTKVVSTTYRNGAGGSQKVGTYLFSTHIPLDTSKMLTSVTLPDMSNLHVFAMTPSTVALSGPVITSISPTTTAAGQQVTITGTGFGASQGSGYVSFGDNGTNWGSPSNSAKLTIDSWSDTSITFTVPTPSGTNGEWAVTPGTVASVAVTTGAGSTSDAGVVHITPSSNLADYYDNAAIAEDGTKCSNVNADGDGWGYSAEALAKAGITPGSTVSSGGISYTFPNVQPCTDDNILAQGQTILLGGNAGATKLGILGMATNGPLTAPVTITYTDGTSSTVNVTLNDWAGGPSGADKAVATMAYRTGNDGTTQTIKMYLYATSVPLAKGRTVASVTLPNVGSNVSNAAFHIFDLALGR